MAWLRPVHAGGLRYPLRRQPAHPAPLHAAEYERALGRSRPEQAAVQPLLSRRLRRRPAGFRALRPLGAGQAQDPAPARRQERLEEPLHPRRADPAPVPRHGAGFERRHAERGLPERAVQGLLQPVRALRRGFSATLLSQRKRLGRREPRPRRPHLRRPRGLDGRSGLRGHAQHGGAEQLPADGRAAGRRELRGLPGPELLRRHLGLAAEQLVRRPGALDLRKVPLLHLGRRGGVRTGRRPPRDVQHVHDGPEGEDGPHPSVLPRPGRQPGIQTRLRGPRAEALLQQRRAGGGARPGAFRGAAGSARSDDAVLLEPDRDAGLVRHVDGATPRHLLPPTARGGAVADPAGPDLRPSRRLGDAGLRRGDCGCDDRRTGQRGGLLHARWHGPARTGGHGAGRGVRGAGPARLLAHGQGAPLPQRRLEPAGAGDLPLRPAAAGGQRDHVQPRGRRRLRVHRAAERRRDAGQPRGPGLHGGHFVRLRERLDLQRAAGRLRGAGQEPRSLRGTLHKQRGRGCRRVRRPAGQCRRRPDAPARGLRHAAVVQLQRRLVSAHGRGGLLADHPRPARRHRHVGAEDRLADQRLARRHPGERRQRRAARPGHGSRQRSPHAHRPLARGRLAGAAQRRPRARQPGRLVPQRQPHQPAEVQAARRHLDRGRRLRGLQRFEPLRGGDLPPAVRVQRAGRRDLSLLGNERAGRAGRLPGRHGLRRGGARSAVRPLHAQRRQARFRGPAGGHARRTQRPPADGPARHQRNHVQAGRRRLRVRGAVQRHRRCRAALRSAASRQHLAARGRYRLRVPAEPHGAGPRRRADSRRRGGRVPRGLPRRTRERHDLRPLRGPAR